VTGDVVLEDGVLRVRLDWFVAAEGGGAFALLFAVLGLAQGGGASAVLFALVAGVAFAALDRWPSCFVAHGDGLVVPTWMRKRWWSRQELRWDEVVGVELVEGRGLNRGRKIRIHTVHGTVDAMAPRDGFFAQDARLDAIVDLVWRQIPPRGPARSAT
jgi:hypothetical protein